jgi:hypothetical protein
MFLLSIVWGEIYKRVSVKSYLWLFWFVAVLPYVCVAFCLRAETILGCLVVSACGMPGLIPMAGDILRACYPPSVRSRVQGVLEVPATFVVIIATLGMGRWLDSDPSSYRIFIPICGAIISFGCVALYWIGRQQLFRERQRPAKTESFVRGMRYIPRNMIRILRGDAVFRWFEIGSITAGLGILGVEAMIPFLVVDKLKLNYTEIAAATYVTFHVAVLILTYPAARLIDRLGPIRVAALGYGVTIIYPILLTIVWNVESLVVASMTFAVGMTAVGLTWMIGPVTLAPSAADASDYTALHSALLGPRTLIAQFSAVAIYHLTGSLEIPMLIGAVLLTGGSLTLLWLSYRVEPTKQALRETEPSPASKRPPLV